MDDRHVVWSNENLNLEDWRADLEEECLLPILPTNRSGIMAQRKIETCGEANYNAPVAIPSERTVGIKTTICLGPMDTSVITN